MKDNVVQVNLWNKNVGLLSWDDKRGYSVFATPKHLAKQPKKHPFSETVNYNAWCELALSKKQEQSSRNLFSPSKISNSISCKN